MATTLEQYLSCLVHGEASYPQFEQKASVLHQFTEGYSLEPLVEVLPPFAQALARDLPPTSTWIPEVQSNLIYCAMRDRYFDSDDAFVDFAYERNYALLAGPLYKAVFRMLSSQRVSRLIASAWGQFHRGSHLAVIESDKRHVRMQVTHPEWAYPEFLVRALATGGRAALEIGGETGVSIEVTERKPDSSSYILQWA